MKRNLVALFLVAATTSLAGCAELQPQMANTQQPAQMAPQQPSSGEQVAMQQQPQESSFFGEIIKTATETLSNEAQHTIRTSIQEAGSSIRN